MPWAMDLAGAFVISSRGSIFSLAKTAFGAALPHFLLGFVGFLLFLLAARTLVAWFVCRFTANCLIALPPEHRRLRPGMVWLLMIPLFPYVWNYFIFPPLAESYADCFRARGIAEPSNCGWGMSLALCICSDASLLPGLALIALFCELVLLVVVLLNFRNLRARLVAGGQDVPVMAKAVVPTRDRSRAGFGRLAAGFLGLAMLQAIKPGGFSQFTTGRTNLPIDAAVSLLSVAVALNILILFGLHFLVGGAKGSGRQKIVRPTGAKIVVALKILIYVLNAAALGSLLHFTIPEGGHWFYRLMNIYLDCSVVISAALSGLLLYLTAKFVMARRQDIGAPLRFALLSIRTVSLLVACLLLVLVLGRILSQPSLLTTQLTYSEPFFSRVVKMAYWAGFAGALLLALVCAVIGVRMNAAEARPDSSAQSVGGTA